MLYSMLDHLIARPPHARSYCCFYKAYLFTLIHIQPDICLPPHIHVDNYFILHPDETEIFDTDYLANDTQLHSLNLVVTRSEPLL